MATTPHRNEKRSSRAQYPSDVQAAFLSSRLKSGGDLNVDVKGLAYFLKRSAAGPRRQSGRRRKTWAVMKASPAAVWR